MPITTRVERVTSVTVTASQDFEYRGTLYGKGEPVTMRPIEAAVHARKGNVSLSPIIENRQMVAQVPALSPKRARKRAYKRRDMTAKDPQ